MGDQFLVARVDQMPGQPLGEAELVIDLPQSQHPGIAGEPLGPILDADRTVEIERKQGRLLFTHWVSLRGVASSSLITPTLPAEGVFSMASPSRR